MSHAAIHRYAASLLLLAACGRSSGDKPAATESAAPAGAPATSAAVPATGHIIEVKVISDEQGNRFEPNKVEAKRGDVLRITLVSGAHNISFPADKNPGAVGLPAPSPVLQLPGQTQDIPITFGPGEYHFQCDPHAPLGMTGTLDVDD